MSRLLHAALVASASTSDSSTLDSSMCIELPVAVVACLTDVTATEPSPRTTQHAALAKQHGGEVSDDGSSERGSPSVRPAESEGMDEPPATSLDAPPETESTARLEPLTGMPPRQLYLDCPYRVCRRFS